MNNKAQLHTLEGLGAAVLMTLTILAITQSTMIVTPQNALAVDVQLEQMSSDALAVLDIASMASVQYNLTECIASWDMAEPTYPTGNLDNLDTALSYLLPGILYNVDLAYTKSGNLNVEKVIINGPPSTNAVVARRYVTLTNQTVNNMGGGWSLQDDELRVVEVRMTAWKV
ncbi:DUF7288 family protein [Methanolobus psychrotolerans]|uniref:DUF7288 family protein n=1 Tax=Methanolobus psychrotolerans TaxID=1874706 RepID=UPI000B91764B|nr:hypothetical protein [Methanolobus psychrotolerans]